jgi:hypothetical protein
MWKGTAAPETRFSVPERLIEEIILFLVTVLEPFVRIVASLG